MKLLPLLAGTVAALLGHQTHLLGAAELYREDFESGSLRPEWQASGTNDGRVRVTSLGEPSGGSYHLLLDDAVADATFSVAEATLRLNLANKKNVQLSFTAKSLGNEPHEPPPGNFTGTRAYDGVAISIDGGVTWRAVYSLANVSGTTTTCSVGLDLAAAQLGGALSRDVRIRFSAYDNAYKGIDGIAIDDVVVTGDDDQRIVLEMPSRVVENTGPFTGYVLLSIPPTSPLTVSLSSSVPGALTLPASVEVPAGQTAVSFNFSVPDDPNSNLPRTVSILPSAPDATATATSVLVVDPLPPLLALTLPAQLAEGGPAGTGIVSVDRAPSANLTVSLSASVGGELQLPGSVVILAGQTQASFSVAASYDTRIDGNVLVVVSATATGLATATASVTTIDAQTRTLALSFSSPLQEGAQTIGSCSIPGTLSSNLVVNLTSSLPGALGLPASVTIPAGSTSVSFTITAVDNSLRDGSRLVDITAAAPTFTSAVRSLTIRDNDIGAYRFGALTDLVPVGSPVAITISATDIEGNPISGYSGSANVSLVLPDGSQTALGTVAISGTGYSGNLVLPNVSDSPLRLRVTDAAGNTADSAPFDPMRIIPLVAGDIAWDAPRNQLYVSAGAAAGGGNANKVLAWNPDTLATIRSVTLTNNPGQLALTSGGEFLYVVQRANGTIVRVDASDFSVAQTFAVGTSPSYGTLYAEDIVPVVGQPNLLVVSRFRTSVSPRHGGVAVFDNGVPRAATTQDHTGSNVVEPSADPSIFFGYCTESTEFGFRRLRVDASGITELEVNGSLINGFSQDIRSAGNYVVSTSGVAVNGAQLRRLGTFAATSPAAVAVDLASNRVFFVERSVSYSSFDTIGAYDPVTFTATRRLTMPAQSNAIGLIRFGTTGLAFRTDTSVVVINSRRLVPTDPPADVRTVVQATPVPATVGAPLTYTVTVTNDGPNPARNTLINATLSDGQTFQNAASPSGTPTVSGSNISLSVPLLASGASVTVFVTTAPTSAGTVSLTASAGADAVDPNFANNTGYKLVSVGFTAGADLVNSLRITANGMLFDAGRSVYWVTIPSTVAAPLGKSLIALDPATGLVSDPISLGAAPMPQAMALSPNGRYLYIGLSDVPEVHRLDLSTSPPTALRIPLGNSQWGSANFAQDIEVLEGDGTSFLIAGSDDHAAAAYDGATRRTTRTGIYTVDRVERTKTTNVFAGYLNYTSGFYTTRLQVDAGGVNTLLSVSNLIGGYSTDIRTSGDLLVSSTGLLVDAASLTLRSNFGVSGRPAVDSGNQRAFYVTGPSFRAFDTNTGNAAGSIALPTTSSGDWALSASRWGLDGFAVLGADKIFLGRWSGIVLPGNDANGNGIDDAWETAYGGGFGVNATADSDRDGIPDVLEYLLGSSPVAAGASPVRVDRITSGHTQMMRVTFPRRSGVTASRYAYEVSSDLQQWQVVSGVVEVVGSSQVVGGVQVNPVEATFPAPAGPACYVRLKWLGQ